MTLILHITTRKEWEEARRQGIYKNESLRTQGFIHCAYPNQLEKVANYLFQGQKDLVLLCIESNRIHANVREKKLDDESYPHIFGPLNLDAITKVLDFKPDKNGGFRSPAAL